MSEQAPTSPRDPRQHAHYEGYTADNLDAILNPAGPAGNHDSLDLSGPDRRSLDAGFGEVAQSYDQQARIVSGADFERVHQLARGNDQEVAAHASELATWSPQDRAAFTSYHMAKVTGGKNTQTGAHDQNPHMTSAQRSAQIDQLETQLRESTRPVPERTPFPPFPSNQELIKRKQPNKVRRALGRLGMIARRPRNWPR